MANKSIPQLPALSSPATSLYDDLFHIVRNNLDYKGTAAQVFGVKQLTYAEAQSLIAAKQLIPSINYYITQMPTANQTGGILLRAITSDLFAINGLWYRPTNLKAFGFISFVGTSGQIDSISVSGIGTVTQYAVPFNTTLKQTAIDVAASINALGAVRAIAVQNGVVIEALTSGMTLNGATLSAVYSGGDMAGDLNYGLNYGADDYLYPLEVEYVFDDDSILRAVDTISFIDYSVPANLIAFLGYNPINYFRWGDTNNTQVAGFSVFFGCQIESANFRDFFAYNCCIAGNQFYSGNLTECIFLDSILVINSSDIVFTTAGSLFRNINFSATEFISCNLSDGAFINFDAKKSSFKDVSMQKASFANVKMNSCIFLDTDLLFYNITLSDIHCSGSQILAGNFTLNLKSPNFGTNPATNGAVIPLFIVPNEFAAYGFTLTWGDFVQSGGGSNLELIRIGIETDGDDCLLIDTTLADINSANQQGIAPVPSTDRRRIIATTSGGETLDAGSFAIQIKGMLKPV